jgi:hypothetical protein
VGTEDSGYGIDLHEASSIFDIEVCVTYHYITLSHMHRCLGCCNMLSNDVD